MFGSFKAILLVLAIAVGSVYAFLDQNTATNSAAVYKTSMMLGYDVTAIIFDVNDADPAAVDTITFRVAPSSGSMKANHVKIQTKPDGIWTECSLVDEVLPARTATCAFGSLAIEDVITLKIVAE